LGILLTIDSHFFVGMLTVAATLACVVFGQTLKWRTPAWKNNILPIISWVLAIALGGTLLFYIEKTPWAVGFELLSLVTLFIITYVRLQDSRDSILGIVTVTLTAFMLQAMLLRFFGPDRILNVTDLTKMQMPAAISLLWASLGGGLCWWSTRTYSRSLWSFGAVLLALSAVKLVLLDFGSLSQLGNIVALIAAGGVFLVVAWLAPFPPKARDDKGSDDQPHIPTGPKPVVPMAVEAHANSNEPSHIPTSVKPEALPSHQRASRRNHAPELVASSTRSTLISLAIGISIILIGAILYIYQRARAPLPPIPPTLSQSIIAPEETAPVSPPPVSPVNPSQKMVESGTPPKVIDACSQFLERLPNDYLLHAGGAYAGRKLNFQIDDSGQESTQFDVVVNEPGREIVLALGAYEPSIWNIRWTPQTRIVGVYVSGYHRQAVAGLDPNTPVLNSSYENRGVCGYFYISSGDVKTADNQIRRIFGRTATSYHLASNGQLEIGQPLNGNYTVQSNQVTVESFRDADAPLAGEAGLEQLVREGKLRPARRDDMRAWEEAKSRKSGQPHASYRGSQGSTGEASSTVIRGAYVVLRPMRYPAGLYGAHSATFIVQNGAPIPEGNPGHSAVLDMNALD